MADDEYAYIEDTDERPETEEKKRQEMENGELEENVYSEAGRENLAEDDEVENWEEGFSKGADEEGKDAKCRYCGKILSGTDFYERKIDGMKCLFCSEEHAERYIEKKSKSRQGRH
ncbi:MAG: hypothetical protein R6U32_00665 [Candidatus Woesearchaeota archaeon]